MELLRRILEALKPIPEPFMPKELKDLIERLGTGEEGIVRECPAGASKREYTADEARAICAKAGVEYKADLEKRIVSFIASTEAVDRMGDIIRVAGWKLENFHKNPVILWGHGRDEVRGTVPVGQAVNTYVDNAAKALVVDVLYPTEEEDAFAANIGKLAKAGYIRAVSVGFRALKSRWVEDAAELVEFGMKRPGIEFIEQELLEISNVGVPANQEAVRLSFRSLNHPSRDIRCAPTFIPEFGFPVRTATEAEALALTARFSVEIEEKASAANADIKAFLLSRGVACGCAADDLKQFGTHKPEIEEKAGAVLSKANKDRLEAAKAAIDEVLSSAMPPEDEDDGKSTEVPNVATEPAAEGEDLSALKEFLEETYKGQI